MFKIGDYVVSANNGISQIEDRLCMSMSGEKKEYFLLVPIHEKTAKVYIPVEKAEQRLRPVMSEVQAMEFIAAIKDIDEMYIENEKERERVYKAAINSCEPKRLVGIIKTLYLRRAQRVEAGKKTTAVDDRYFKQAEHQLHAELAFALKKDIDEVKSLIVNSIS